jgi:drug/metabolite transporter (DMT)-like permease
MLLIASVFIFGCSLSFCARYTLSSHGLAFPSAMLYTSLHMLATWLVSLPFVRRTTETERQQIRANAGSLLVLGAAEALSIWCNNAALGHTTVSINQSIKALAPLLLLCVGHRRSTRFDAQLCACFILVCGIVGMVQGGGDAAPEERRDLLPGVGLTLASLVFVVVRFKLHERLLHDRQFARWGVLSAQSCTSGVALGVCHLVFEPRAAVTRQQAAVVAVSAAFAVAYNVSIIFMAERFEALQNSIIASLRQALLILVATVTESDFTLDKLLFGVCVGSAGVLHNMHDKDLNYKHLAGSCPQLARTAGVVVTTVAITFGMGLLWRTPDAAADVVPAAPAFAVPQWQCPRWDGSARVEVVYARYGESYEQTGYILALAERLRAPMTVYQAVDAPRARMPTFHQRNMTDFLARVRCVRLRYHPNMQDEAGAYVHYIVERYETLPQHVVFVKGSFADVLQEWYGRPPDALWLDFAEHFVGAQNASVGYASLPTNYDDCRPLCRVRENGANVLAARVPGMERLSQPTRVFHRNQIVATRAAIRSGSAYDALLRLAYYPKGIDASHEPFPTQAEPFPNQRNQRHGTTRHLAWWAFALEWGGFQALFGGVDARPQDLCNFLDAAACERFTSAFRVMNSPSYGDICRPCNE